MLLKEVGHTSYLRTSAYDDEQCKKNNKTNTNTALTGEKYVVADLEFCLQKRRWASKHMTLKLRRLDVITTSGRLNNVQIVIVLT